MRTHTTWLDHLRARLSGLAPSVYAIRRAARTDLHALEARRAQAAARLNEDIELLDRYVNPLERYRDGDRLLTPLGTILDRRSGKNLPLVWTELDLREFRRWSRVLCDINPFAVGFLGLLTDFHIRQGFGWQATSVGLGPSSFEKTRSPLGLGPLSFVETPESGDSRSFRRTEAEGLRTKYCQAVLNEWRDQQRWAIKSREAFRRWRRDGEVFLRFFRGGAETRGLPVIRFVEPEQVGPPPGDDADGRWSFGVLTEPEDVESIQAYFVRDPLGSGSEGEEVPAGRILHLKANVDSSIKRGLPDFLPVQEDLERVRRMLRNMGEVAAIQTAIAWVSQYATATAEQVGTLIRAGSDYTRPKIGDPSGKLMDVVTYEPGTVLHMDSNRQFVAGPVGSGTAGFIQVEQAILRGCGSRWRFPEYFSGDASNNNMASSIVAGSPFVVAVEGNQLEWGVFERAVAAKVLALCVESGRLSPELVAGVDVKVTPPAVALANREEEERLRQMRHEAGVLSVTTWQQQVGLDPQHEAKNFAAEARRKSNATTDSGSKGGGKASEAKLPCACEEWLTESDPDKKDQHFTGELKDAIGRKRCYQDGKQVPCPTGAGTTAGSDGATLSGKDAAKSDQKEPEPNSNQASISLGGESPEPNDSGGGGDAETGKRNDPQRSKTDAFFKNAPLPSTPEKALEYLSHVPAKQWAEVGEGGPAAERLAEHVAAVVFGQKPREQYKGLSDVSVFEAELKGGQKAKVAVNGKLTTLRSNGEIRVGKGNKLGGYWYEQRQQAKREGLLLATLGVHPGYPGRPGGLFLKIPAGDMYFRKNGSFDQQIIPLVQFDRLADFVKDRDAIGQAMRKAQEALKEFDMKDWDEMTKKEQLEFQSRSGSNSTAEEAGAFAETALQDEAKRQVLQEKTAAADPEGTAKAAAAVDAKATAEAAAAVDAKATAKAVAAVDARATAEAAAAVDQEAIFAVAAKLAGMTLDQYKKILKLGNGAVS